MARTKTITIGIGATLTSILLALTLISGVKLDVSGDITCSGNKQFSSEFNSDISDCQIFWNVTSVNYTIKLQNKKGIKLDFSPKEKEYVWFVKEKGKWKQLDYSGNFTFKKGIKYEFTAFIFKEPSEDVKWGILAANKYVDPILFGIKNKEITPIQKCQISSTEVTKLIHNEVIKTKQYEHCTNESGLNTTCQILSTDYTSYEVTGSYIDYQNDSICKTIGYTDKKIEYYCPNEDSCFIEGGVVRSEPLGQSNLNGEVESGEEWDYFDFSNKEIKSNSKVSKKEVILIEK